MLIIQPTNMRDKIIKYFEDISGEWNGEDEGILEERAMIAHEILDLIKGLEE